ncbi:restriction endonuclease subunit S [Streptococcus zalophi]|uniref:Restriction endonuclease subunit S n=1 Tax=Streptococcus zalophi TaxID=640031 RepID=A0A934UDU9_9STRE|nr:restriction endonuclease subunit S [Streptococcus zalophi]MBJ8350192.1 restriction endonuclease subunit S [Streptococcus zalophi]
MTKQTIPKIRFREFDDKWEIKKIKEILKEKNEKTVENNQYPIISSTTKGLILQNDYFNRQIASKDNVGYKIIKKNELVFSPQNIWMGNLNVNFKFDIGILSPSYKIFEFINTDVNFQRYYLKTPKMLFQYEQSSEQGASIVRRNLNMDNFYNILINLPSLPEQKAIGSLFNTLDNLLTSYKDNLSHYQSFKETMLSKMFPRDGQTTPEIRLEGFEGKWEKKTIQEMSESIEYGINAPAKEFDGENKYLRITDVDDVSRKFLKNKITSPDIDLSLLDNYLLKKNDLLFARTGASVGKSYIYSEEDGKVYFAGFLIRVRIKESYDDNFVFQNTLTDRYKRYIEITSQRSGQPGVNGKEYGMFSIFVPEFEEQKIIGTFFANLDNIITSYQDKIDNLELLKKKLLKDMFV